MWFSMLCQCWCCKWLLPKVPFIFRLYCNIKLHTDNCGKQKASVWRILLLFFSLKYYFNAHLLLTPVTFCADNSLLFTVWLHVMQCTVLLLQFCLSVCLSIHQSDVCIVERLNDALWIFWYHTKGQSLCYSDTNSSWSVTPPSFWNLRSVKWPPLMPNWSYHVTSISCIRQMALRSHYSCLPNSSVSRPAQNHWQCWQLHNGLFGRRQSHGLSSVAELLVLKLLISFTFIYVWRMKSYFKVWVSYLNIHV